MRRACVADDRVGHELAALAQKAEAEGDIDVFVVAEIPFVEAARLRERDRADRARRRRTARSIRRQAARFDSVMTEAAAPGIAIGEIAVACAVELCGLVQADLQAGDHAMRRALVDGAHHGREPVRRGFSVGVEQGEPLAARRRARRYCCRRRSRDSRPARRMVRRGGLFDDAIERAVGRGVVDDDGLEVGEGLARQRGEAAAQVVAAIVVDDDDRDRRARGLGRSRRSCQLRGSTGRSISSP